MYSHPALRARTAGTMPSARGSTRSGHEVSKARGANLFKDPRTQMNNRLFMGANSASNKRRNRSRSRTRTARPRSMMSIVGGQADEVICAINEARGIAATVGLAFVNLSAGECFMSQICDTQTYIRTVQKLTVFDPLEIIIPDSPSTPGNSKLLSIVAENLPGANVIPISRKYYNESAGHDYIKHLSFTEDTEAILVATSEKYYAISAVAAVLKFAEMSHNVSFTAKTLRMSYQASEGTMLIDFNTVKNMELIQNIQNPKSTDSLYGLLNNTLTPMGARLLRTNVLQPSISKELIEVRLDAVKEFAISEEVSAATRKALKQFLDMDRLLTTIITIPAQATLKTSEQAINDIIMLKKELDCVGPLCAALTEAESEMLKLSRSYCGPEKIKPIQNLIDSVINPDVTWAKSPLDLRNQRCYAVKSGVNGLLDVARQTYKETTDDVHTHMDELIQTHELPLELKFEVQRGYYFRIPSVELEERHLPPVFVNVLNRKKFTEFMTLGLVKLNCRISESLTEVLLSSDKTVQELMDKIRAQISVLFKISEVVGLLDMLQSFAYLAVAQEYVRPEFADALAVTNGRHPIREKIHKAKFIPNDIYATQQTRFQVITGCNMSGKSTYIRKIALLTIMAQIGSFIPAIYASFPMTRHLFARVSTDDDIESNVSTFAAEMRETAFILHNVEKGSLVIVDELGRGTSSRDGLALAVSISEALIETKALVFFATHFRDLPHILSERSGVVKMYMQVEITDDNKTLNMLYKISDGVVEEKHYGLALARIARLPNEILDRATRVSRTLLEKSQQRNKSSRPYRESRRRRLLLALHERLVQLKDGRMSDQALRSFLANLQEDFSDQMYELQGASDLEDDAQLERESADTTMTSDTYTSNTSNSNSNALDFDTSDTSNTVSATTSGNEVEEEEYDDEDLSSTPLARSGYFSGDTTTSTTTNLTVTLRDEADTGEEEVEISIPNDFIDDSSDDDDDGVGRY